MLKFFRKIRKNLLIENKTAKYFKYAIGEIALVMIGILLALQVNNWNNNRIDSKREVGYIKNIERDLKNQLKAIDIQIDFEEEVVEYCRIALKPYNETNTLKIDSAFAVAIGSITTRRTFLNPNPAYTELISSGNIELLKNETFKNQLINYYQELERIEKIIDKNNTFYTDQQFSHTMFQLSAKDDGKEWDNLFKGYMRKYRGENPLSSSNIKHLTTISAKLLADEKNELIFINHLDQRQGTAMYHVYLMLEFKAQTRKLLETIKEY
jgi:hypothetical protein